MAGAKGRGGALESGLQGCVNRPMTEDRSKLDLDLNLDLDLKIKE
jgi:hypothetical protein